MLTEILMESLMSMDEDTLNSVLESCDIEELDFIDTVVTEMSKADFDAENINTFKRNDHLKSFKLDNGTGMDASDFGYLKRAATDYFSRDEKSLDKYDNARVNLMRGNVMANNIRKHYLKLGVSNDVANKIAKRTADVYFRAATKASDNAYGRREDRLVNQLNKEFSENPSEFIAKYNKWVDRENRKLSAKYSADNAKAKLVQKLNNFKPSDLKA